MDSRKVTLDDLVHMDEDLSSRKSVHTRMIRSLKYMTDSMAVYGKSFEEEGFDRDHYKDMEAGIKLRSSTLMGFSNDGEFGEIYDRYRLTVFKSVETYRRLEELRDEDPERFTRSLESLRMTVTTFEKMSDRINLLEIQGRYMDERAKILANPFYLSLDEKKMSRLRSMSMEDLQNEISELEEGVDHDNKRRMLEGLVSLKKMEKYGIGAKAESTRNKVSTYEKKLSGRNKNGIFSFNTGYYDLGIKSKNNPKKGFWDYIKNRKWKISSSDSNSKYGKIGGEVMEAANIKTNLAMGKYRVAKIGGKFADKSRSFTAGAHISGGTVKGAAEIGFSMTAGRLWQNKIYAAANATAYGVRGVAKVSAGYRKDRVKADGRTEGNIGYVQTGVQGGVGLIRHEDDRGRMKEGFGVAAKISAKAAVFEGSIGGGITIFGVRIGARVMGNAISAGASVKAAVTTGRISFGLSAALGLGTGFEMSIDWTGLKEKFNNWRKRRKQKKKLRELHEQEKAQKKKEKTRETGGAIRRG